MLSRPLSLSFSPFLYSLMDTHLASSYRSGTFAALLVTAGSAEKRGETVEQAETFVACVSFTGLSARIINVSSRKREKEREVLEISLKTKYLRNSNSKLSSRKTPREYATRSTKRKHSRRPMVCRRASKIFRSGTREGTLRYLNISYVPLSFKRFPNVQLNFQEVRPDLRNNSYSTNALRYSTLQQRHLNVFRYNFPNSLSPVSTYMFPDVWGSTEVRSFTAYRIYHNFPIPGKFWVPRNPSVAIIARR